MVVLAICGLLWLCCNYAYEDREDHGDGPDSCNMIVLMRGRIAVARSACRFVVPLALDGISCLEGLGVNEGVSDFQGILFVNVSIPWICFLPSG